MAGTVKPPTSPRPPGPLVRAERRGPDDVADATTAQRGRVVEDEPLPVQVSDAAEEPEELGRGGGDDRLRHRRASSEGGAEMAPDRLRPNPTAPRPHPGSA